MLLYPETFVRLTILNYLSYISALFFVGNTLLHMKFWYEHVETDDGIVHWKIIKHDIKYEVEKAMFRLENLLNDKTLGKFDNIFLIARYWFF